MVNLGSRVRDSLTGFEGVAIARISHLYGCVHIAILPTELKDGSPQKERIFDEQRVEVLTASDRPAKTPLYELGNVVRDTITGLTGVITVWADEISNAPLVSITSQSLHEGRPIDSSYLTEGRLELVKATRPAISPDSSATSGSISGDFPLSSSRSY